MTVMPEYNLEVKMKKIIILSFLSIVLIGCATTNEQYPSMSSEQKTVVGPGLTSPAINALMDNEDRTKVKQFLATSTKNQHVNWQSATNQAQFELTSLNIFVNDEGLPCRTYQATATKKEFLSNQNLQTNATSCRQADGNWKLISSHEP